MQITDPRYNNKFPVRLETDRYVTTDNISIRGVVLDPDGFEEPWCSYTTNPDSTLPKHHVCIKTWSEGEGSVQVLLAANIIEGVAIDHIPCGFVVAPVYALTDKAIKELGL